MIFMLQMWNRPNRDQIRPGGNSTQYTFNRSSDEKSIARRYAGAIPKFRKSCR